MAFEDKEAELGMLFTQMQNEPEDWCELYEQIAEAQRVEGVWHASPG